MSEATPAKGEQVLGLDAEKTRLGAASAVVAGIGLVWLAGLPGVGAAAVLAIAAYLLPATYAFAVGQVALVALAPGGELLGVANAVVGGSVIGSALVGVAVAEVGLFGVLLAPATRVPAPGPPVALAVAWALVGGALAWTSAGAGAPLKPWLAGLALVVLTVLAAYALHRYQLVSLGLVDDENPTSGDSAGGAPDEQ